MVDVTVPPGAAPAPDPTRHRGGSDDGRDDAGDVAVVRWPAEAARREDLARQRRARLLVVAVGERPPPPAPDSLEDWVREGVDPVEVFVRKDRLRRRQDACVPATLDDDGVLHRGRWWVALSGRDVQVAGVLLARPGALVARADVLHAVSPGAVRDERRLVDSVVRRFGRRVAPLGLRVHTVRCVGFLLEMGELPVV